MFKFGFAIHYFP